MLRTRLVLIFLLLMGGVVAISAQDDDSESCADPCQSADATPEFGLSAEEIAAYEVPELDTLFIDEDLLNDRWYMQVTGTVNVFDAPGGNVIRTLDNGFNFMTALERQGEWVQINPGEWMQVQNLTDSNSVISRFTGVFLPEEPLEYTMAWLLVNLYPSKVPGGDPRESNGLHYRYTPVTIFATGEVDGYRWYQIGAEMWVHQHHVSKIQPIERPDDVETDLWVGIDLYEQNLIVYENGRPIFATLVSTGLDRWPTYEGTYHIYWRRTRDDMTWGTVGDDYYYLEDVPWTMYFDEGRALHGAYWHDGLGYRRSHGCVNMSITDAHWLYHYVAQGFDKLNSPDIEEGPAVHVYNSETNNS